MATRGATDATTANERLNVVSDDGDDVWCVKTHNRTWSSSAAMVWTGRNRNTGDGHFNNRKRVQWYNAMRTVCAAAGKLARLAGEVLLQTEMSGSSLWVYSPPTPYNNNDNNKASYRRVYYYYFYHHCCAYIILYSRGESLSPGMDDEDDRASYPRKPTCNNGRSIMVFVIKL